MTSLFQPNDESLDGFDAWWSLFPQDRYRSSRKSGKSICKAIWRVKLLGRKRSRVIEAIKRDVNDINSGKYALCKDSMDKMHWFPTPKNWLNNGWWERDDIEDKAPSINNKNPCQKNQDSKRLVLTDEMRAKYRKMARIRSDKVFE